MTWLSAADRLQQQPRAECITPTDASSWLWLETLNCAWQLHRDIAWRTVNLHVMPAMASARAFSASSAMPKPSPFSPRRVKLLSDVSAVTPAVVTSSHGGFADSTAAHAAAADTRDSLPHGGTVADAQDI